jgi:hypothetical protein
MCCLPALVELDLSDMPITQKDIPHPWSALLQSEGQNAKRISDLWKRLTWLGVPDFRDPAECFTLSLVQQVLPRCHNLQTLSIRGQRSGEIANPHDYVCKLPSIIAKFVPQGVVTLELRLPFLFLDHIQEALSSAGSSITNIGIDFGAWVQDYPRLKPATNELEEQDIVGIARAVARKRRTEAYEEAHNEIFVAGEKWWLPKTRFDMLSSQERDYHGDGKHAFERNFYLDGGARDQPAVSTVRGRHGASACPWNTHGHHVRLIQYLERTNTSTLPMMLDHLHRMGTAHLDFKLFALTPEWQENSTNPIHPFALLQRLPSRAVLNSEGAKNANSANLEPIVYKWLNTTFNWRPVFDWDWFIRPKHESTEEDTTKIYDRLKQQRGLNDSYSQVGDLVAEMAKHFEIMKGAGIPVHLLIGRRHPDFSTLYWGWPYDDSSWKKWLKAPFDSSLCTIAPLIDTLSVLYDLRNPLDEDRLQAIDSLSAEGSLVGSARCPRPVYPWAKTDQECPCPQRWHHGTSITHKQKMANKRYLKATSISFRLAPNMPSLPPTGHYAQEIDPNSFFDESLHEVARLAAYEREAVGWQRFWNTYATKFTDLSELNVRMPRCFDGVGSVKLARLLDPAKGWSMVAYADETGDVQAKADVEDGQEKRWSAGGFVRRSWIRRLPAPASLQTGMMAVMYPNAQEDEDKIERREKEQLDKAVERAAMASAKEEGLQSKLKAKSDNCSKSMHNSTTGNADVERKLTGNYGSRVRRIAQRTWRTHMQNYIEELRALDTNSGEETRPTPVRDVLLRTRHNLECQIHTLCPSDIFDEDDNMKNGVGLVKQTRNCTAEENERRERPTATAATTAPEGTQEPENCDDQGLCALPSRVQPQSIKTSIAHVGGEISSQDDVAAQVQDLPAVLQTHAIPSIVPEPSDANLQVQDLLAVLQRHGTSIQNVPDVPQATETQEVVEIRVDVTRREDTTSQVEGVSSSVEVEQYSHLDQSVDDLSEDFVPEQMGTMGEPTTLRESTPLRESPLRKELTLPRELTPPKQAMLPSEPTLPRKSTPPSQSAPFTKPKPVSDPTSKQPPLPKISTPIQSAKESKEPKQTTPAPHPSPFSPTPTPTPRKRALRRRKDPVITDDLQDLSSGRKLRSSRSVTPAKSYKETSDLESDSDKDQAVKKGRREGRGKKRAADEEWNNEEAGDGESGDGDEKKVINKRRRKGIKKAK